MCGTINRFSSRRRTAGQGLSAVLRTRLGIPKDEFFCDTAFGDLDHVSQENVRRTLEPGFFKYNNPIVRHTVLRRRSTLEKMGLLDKIAVNVNSGKATAERILKHHILDEEQDSDTVRGILDELNPEEVSHLQTIIEELSRPEARDSKLEAV